MFCKTQNERHVAWERSGKMENERHATWERFLGPLFVQMVHIGVSKVVPQKRSKPLFSLAF